MRLEKLVTGNWGSRGAFNWEKGKGILKDSLTHTHTHTLKHNKKAGMAKMCIKKVMSKSYKNWGGQKSSYAPSSMTYETLSDDVNLLMYGINVLMPHSDKIIMILSK